MALLTITASAPPTHTPRFCGSPASRQRPTGAQEVPLTWLLPGPFKALCRDETPADRECDLQPAGGGPPVSRS